MKERPILFSGPMVRALLDGRKTQTRRAVKLRDFGPSDTKGYDWHFRDRQMRWQDYRNDRIAEKCPYGLMGDPEERLWVREELARAGDHGIYRADGADLPYHDSGSRYLTDRDGSPLRELWHWKNDTLPSIHCPRWASRITLEIVSVGVERLQDISGEDAKAEGIGRYVDGHGWGCDADDCARNAGEDDGWRTPIDAFRRLWEKINGPGSWNANPFVWRIEFRRLDRDG